MNDALCGFCQDIFHGELEDWEARSGYGNDLESLDSEQIYYDEDDPGFISYRFLKDEPHHDSLDQLKQCGEDFCRLCAALWSQTSQKDQQEWIMSESNTKAFDVENKKNQLFYELQLNLDFSSVEIDLYSAATRFSRLTLKSYSLNQNLDMTMRYVKGIDSATSSARTLQLAAQWLTQCRTMHSKCRLDQISGWLPSRLLHVGSENKPPSLCLRSSIPPGSVYNTLSHCWGSAPTMKLTIRSLQSFLGAIPLISLPNTYADAIHVTRAMKVNYIWIDSLCIIQDSTEDWETECMEMANVYRNGVLNISALHAVDSKGGCFSYRDSSLLAPLVVQSYWEGFEQSMWLWEPDTAKDFKESPLQKRGWVVQERALSPRVLHFGKTMVHWECRELRSSECRPMPFGRQKKFFLEKHVNSQSLYQYVELWSDLVAEYGKTSLTYAKDKLVAFSAVAKSIQAASEKLTDKKWAYYSGLWAPYIEFQLIWHALDPATSPPTEYRAPSWSWAATDNFTWIPNDWYQDGKKKMKTFIHVRDIQVLHKGTDPFLEVEGGHILLVCLLWKLDPTYPSQKTFAEGLELIWDVEGTLESLDGMLYIVPVRIKYEATGEANMSKYVVLIGLIVEQSGPQFRRKGIFNFRIRTLPVEDGDLETKEPASRIYLLGEMMYDLGVVSSNLFGPPNLWISPDRYINQLWTQHNIELI